jgi:two-component system, cell cycle sensor histidine kinase DivJ
VSGQRLNLKDMRDAYSRLCAAWVSDRAAASERPALERLFKVIFVLPALGSAAAFAALCAGAEINAVFAAFLIIFTATLMLGAFAANAVKAVHVIMTAALGAGVAAGALMPLTGPAALLPLALIAGGESQYVSRDAKLSGLAALVAICAALATGWFAGIGVSGALTTIFMTGVSMAHVASLALRGLGSDKAEAAPRQPSVADTLMAAGNSTRLKISLMGEVAEVDGHATELLGASADVLKGFGLYERVLVSDKVAYLSALDAMRAGTEKVELRLRLRNGVENGAFSTFDVLFCKMAGDGIAVLIEAAPEPEAVKPITDEKIHADRYLAGVSHELRTPLNAILGFSDILRQDMFGAMANERQREYVELIHQSGAHLLSVVNMILDVSKLDAGAYQIVAEPFEVEEAVSMSLAMVREQAMAKKIELTCALDPSAAQCTADQRAVQQMLINLLSNAVKFTPEGGSVKVASSQEEGYLVLNVSDSGIGISERDLERIGQPFYQVQNDYTRAFEGTGLGLSLVRGLVELHQGGFSIESETGKGTAVTIRLPLNGPSVRRTAPVKLSERRHFNFGDSALNCAATGGEAVLAGQGAIKCTVTEIEMGEGHEPAIRRTA